jgi:L-seryl-tRNA(Ser) seleniumtransferase
LVKTPSQPDLLRRLPSVDELLRQPAVAALVAGEGHTAVADAARIVLSRLREEVSAGRIGAHQLDLAIVGLAEAIARELHESLQPSLRPVVNATGVILHTNLGRAPIAAHALDHMRAVASGYSNLEFDLTSGERGQRDSHAARLFSQLFAQQLGEASSSLATVVVNNNAAAVLLALNTLAEGGEVIVSRGELVEIGGSFRIPEVMAKAGVTLREVGATNRTRISDYEHALGEKTRLLLRVHRSNFKMVGFTEQPALQELVGLGRKHKVAVLEDLGSGALFDLRQLGVGEEPDVAASLRAGVDVVTYSGDKLLGGPQAGILTGKKALIARIRRNPLFRALRVDKLTYAALEATLLAYIRRDFGSIPALAMMQLPAEEVHRRAHALQLKLAENQKLQVELIAGESVIGGGAAPGATLPTFLLALTHPHFTASALARTLRSAAPMPIIARVEEGRVLLDLRTVFPAQDQYLFACLRSLGDAYHPR